MLQSQYDQVHQKSKSIDRSTAFSEFSGVLVRNRGSHQYWRKTRFEVAHFLKRIWACLCGFHFTCQLLHIPFISPPSLCIQKFSMTGDSPALTLQSWAWPYSLLSCLCPFWELPHAQEWYKPQIFLLGSFQLNVKAHNTVIVNLKAKYFQFFLPLMTVQLNAVVASLNVLFFYGGNSCVKIQVTVHWWSVLYSYLNCILIAQICLNMTDIPVALKDAFKQNWLFMKRLILNTNIRFQLISKLEHLMC